MAEKGQAISGDEVGLFLRAALENLEHRDKVVVADVRRNLSSAKLSGHRGDSPKRKPATITIKTSDQVVRSVKGSPDKSVCHVLVVAITSELIDEYRQKRDSRIIKPGGVIARGR